MPTVVSERDIVLTPQRIVLQRHVVGFEIVIVVVIVVGIFIVHVHDVLAVHMVGEGVTLLFLVFRVGHSILLAPPRAFFPRRCARVNA
jgi:hypothetical protein